MAFTLEQWRQSIHKDIERFAQHPIRSLQDAGITSIYGFLLGSAILPIAHAYGVDPHSAITVLIGVTGGIGGNLVANWIQTKYDTTQTYKTALEESQRPELAPIYDAIANKLSIFLLMEQALVRANEVQFIKTMHEELNRLGKLNRYLGSTSNTQQTGSVNMDDVVNHGPSNISIFGSGTTNIATNQVITNNLLENNISKSSQEARFLSQPEELIDKDTQHRNKLIAAHRDRLRVLQIQAAKFGIETPPHIQNEIDDIIQKIISIQSQSSME